VDAVLISQYVLSGVVIGIIYSLMALGITFIYSVMKMINWAMGEFFMIGSYVQYALIVTVVGPSRWWLALLLVLPATARGTLLQATGFGWFVIVTGVTAGPARCAYIFPRWRYSWPLSPTRHQRCRGAHQNRLASLAI